MSPPPTTHHWPTTHHPPCTANHYHSSTTITPPTTTHHPPPPKPEAKLEKRQNEPPNLELEIGGLVLGPNSQPGTTSLASWFSR